MHKYVIRQACTKDQGGEGARVAPSFRQAHSNGKEEAKKHACTHHVTARRFIKPLSHECLAFEKLVKSGALLLTKTRNKLDYR